MLEAGDSIMDKAQGLPGYVHGSVWSEVIGHDWAKTAWWLRGGCHGTLFGGGKPLVGPGRILFARWGGRKNVPVGGNSMAKSSEADLAQGL